MLAQAGIFLLLQRILACASMTVGSLAVTVLLVGSSRWENKIWFLSITKVDHTPIHICLVFRSVVVQARHSLIWAKG
ncbi:MAG: hypothetical protein B7Z75_02870 [Acidocella sp. 20-57-95]|nr:MAG: hypothetical protein B7Z75_02870 [Acidocella sp. 20-57-95]